MKTNSAKWSCTWLMLALFFPLAAHSQMDRLYVKADVGGNITQSTDLREFFGDDTTGARVKFDPGTRIGIAAGYELCQFFAVEGEVGAMANTIKSISGADRVDAVFVNVPFLVNAKLQAPRNWKLRPYIGAGVGGSASIIDSDHITRNDTDVHGSDGDVVFAWQGFTGFRISINETMGIGFEYRYFEASHATWTAEFASGTASDKMSFGRTQTHCFSVVFDWHF